MEAISPLSESRTVIRAPPSFSIRYPAAISPLYTASSMVRAMPSTSPVDFISGPSWVSRSASFSKEKTGTLTAPYREEGTSPPASPSP